MHPRFPPAFQKAARALLLAAQRNSSSSSTSTDATGTATGTATDSNQLPGAKRRRQRRLAPHQQAPSVTSAAPLGALPAGVLLHIINLSAYPVSAWMGSQQG